MLYVQQLNARSFQVEQWAEAYKIGHYVFQLIY